MHLKFLKHVVCRILYSENYGRKSIDFLNTFLNLKRGQYAIICKSTLRVPHFAGTYIRIINRLRRDLGQSNVEIKQNKNNNNYYYYNSNKQR
jgi:hypothetical protein